MLLALSERIREIDMYSSDVLGIPLRDLMARSGKAVDAVLREHVKPGASVIILAGSGNNGGDGYALAELIMNDYNVKVYDIFSAGQKTEVSKYFHDKYVSLGGLVLPFAYTPEILSEIKGSDCIVDAVFGTGFVGQMPDRLGELIGCVNSSTSAYKIAIDVPLGVNADDGSISDAYACSVDVTVALSFIKPGLVSYPARSFVGKIVYDDIGLPLDKVTEHFDFKYKLIDKPLAVSLLPARREDGNKGTFGSLFVITGSKKYRGAAHLSLEAAVRGGVGRVNYFGTQALVNELLQKLPEVIYESFLGEELKEADVSRAVELSAPHNAVLLGSGSSVTDELYALTTKLLLTEGAPFILDADAINALADRKKEALDILKHAKRTVILTPHPLEFSRISGHTVALVQQRRIELAKAFASEYNCILVLKGAGTVVTDGKEVLINSTGSSALAKAGSGDVLAGFLSALVASGISPLYASALAVYYHGLAADVLRDELSVFGVTPSDLPREIARQIARASEE